MKFTQKAIKVSMYIVNRNHFDNVDVASSLFHGDVSHEVVSCEKALLSALHDFDFCRPRHRPLQLPHAML